MTLNGHDACEGFYKTRHITVMLTVCEAYLLSPNDPHGFFNNVQFSR